MEQFLTDIWRILLTALLAATGWQFRESHSTKNRITALETTITELKESVKKDKEDVEKSVRHLQENVAKDIENIKKDIESIHKRQDSHSKNQDEIRNLINDFKLEVVERIGEVSSALNVITSSIEYYDDGIQLKKEKKGKKKKIGD